jgi:uncharacterized membrane protein
MAEQYTVPPSGDVTDNDKLMALLAYIFAVIVPVIILLAEDMKDRPFQRYHAIQSLGLSAVSLVYEIVACVVFTLLTAVTGGILGICLWFLFLLPVVPAIIYAIQAYQGKWLEIPVLTDFMKQQGWL